MGSVKINILGNEYVLRSEGGEGQLRRVAAHLNARLNEVLTTTNTSSTLAATVLAALNITNELLQLQDKQENLLQEIEIQAERLLEKIEHAQV
ncbi:MAG: cell division protein ZapA [Thermodesulfobacteriota bacterium]